MATSQQSVQQSVQHAIRQNQTTANQLDSLTRLYGDTLDSPRTGDRAPSAYLQSVTRQTTHMTPVDMQLANEHQYNKRHINIYVRTEILGNAEMLTRIDQACEIIRDWMDPTDETGNPVTYYARKCRRIDNIRQMNVRELVIAILVGVAYCQTPEKLTIVAAQLVGKLGFNPGSRPGSQPGNRSNPGGVPGADADGDAIVDGITLTAELMALICRTDAFDIYREERRDSLKVLSRIPLSHRIKRFVEQSCYLPPMLCEPNPITANNQSAYLTYDDSVILRQNHHNDPQALDAINLQNQVPLTLNTEFLSTVEELPTFEIDTIEKQRDWNQFKRESYVLYELITHQMRGNGDRFYLTNRYDKRGRMYASGYHITTQGAPFKKAMLDFVEQEPVNGVPAELMQPREQPSEQPGERHG